VDIIRVVDGAATLRSVRLKAGLTQAQLAARAGTSQATLSAYENGSKQPSLATFSRLLQAAGARLAVEEIPAQRVEPSRRAGARLAQVLALAEALPVRHEPALRYPRLDRRAA
jgi:transcriptional regulator with XRE-family HTH domain